VKSGSGTSVVVGAPVVAVSVVAVSVVCASVIELDGEVVGDGVHA